MRYALLSAAIGAATVSGRAIPEKKDYSNDNVCKVVTTKVRLTSLENFVGHSFPLLTPEQALAGVADVLNKTKGTIVDPNGPPLVTSIPLLTEFIPDQSFPTASGSGPDAGSDAYPTGEAASESGYWTTNLAGESTWYGAPKPTGVKGGSGQHDLPHFPFPTGAHGGAAGGHGAGKPGNGGVDLPFPTDFPFPGHDLPGDLGEMYSSILPVISSAIDHLTKGQGKPLSPSATATATGPDATKIASSGSASASITSSVASQSSAPFPVPSGGSNSTFPVPTGTGVSSIISSSSSVSSSVSSSASSSASGSSSASSTLSSSTRTSSSSSSSASASATGCANPKIRPEWRSLSGTQKKAYADAVKCLMDAPSKGVSGAKNRYEDLVALHQQQIYTIHDVGQFLPWHRYFIHVEETLLKTECNYNGPMPWWDETLDAGHFMASPVFESQYLGSAHLKPAGGKSGICVDDGVFAGEALNVGPGLKNTEHCLARAVDETLSARVTVDFIASCNAYPTFADMQRCQYRGPHAYGHDATGAVMEDVASSVGDPVFFLHHGFVDRNWATWQKQSAAHKKAMGGYTTQTQPSGGWKTTTTDYILSSLGVLPDVKIEKVMDTEGDYLCYKYSY